VLSEAAWGALNRMTRLLNFGESGKIFIEIGKNSRFKKLYLGLRCVPADGISQRGANNQEKQCKSANLEKAPWKFRLLA
jgi:hypothetical protein